MLWPHWRLQTLRKTKNRMHVSFHPAQAGAGCVLQSNIFFVLKNGRDVLRGSAEVLLELREMNPQLGLLHFLPARGADGVPVSWRDLRRRARRAHISFAQISSSRFFFFLSMLSPLLFDWFPHPYKWLVAQLKFRSLAVAWAGDHRIGMNSQRGKLLNLNVLPPWIIPRMTHVLHLGPLGKDANLVK